MLPKNLLFTFFKLKFPLGVQQLKKFVLTKTFKNFPGRVPEPPVFTGECSNPPSGGIFIESCTNTVFSFGRPILPDARTPYGHYLKSKRGCRSSGMRLKCWSHIYISQSSAQQSQLYPNPVDCLVPDVIS